MGAIHRDCGPTGWSAALALILILTPAMVGICEEKPWTLEHGLLQQSAKVIALARGRGHTRLGVLKFLIQREGFAKAPPQDRAGALNTYAASRLEVALALSNPSDASRQIELIRDANSVAAKLPGANIRTTEGREALFKGNYQLAWGGKEVQADAFVSGIIAVDQNLDKMKVALVLIERSSDALIHCATFVTKIERQKVPELDESAFFLRGGFDGGNLSVVETRKNVKESFPLILPDAPVGLEVLYSGRSVPLEFEDGRAMIREPGPGEQVSLRLLHRRQDQHKYAVVLKVNGENTLFRERFRDVECSKWILDGKRRNVVIDGFQLNDNRAARFVVLSDQESNELAMRFGPETGTISLTVFQEGQPAPPPGSDEDEDVAAILMSAFPDTPVKDAQTLKYSLRSAAASVATRGLIFSGKDVGQAIRRVDFQVNPAPVISAVIQYRTSKIADNR